METTMFTATTSTQPDDDRTVITAISHSRGLTRYSWTWTGGTQIAIADRASDTPFDTIASTTTKPAAPTFMTSRR